MAGETLCDKVDEPTVATAVVSDAINLKPTPDVPKHVTPSLVSKECRRLKPDSCDDDSGWPSLLLRFFLDMHAIIENCYRVLRKNGQALIVIGDNRIKVNSDYERIATTDFVEDISTRLGFKSRDRIDISVTRENLVHIKNSITKNVVLQLEKH